MRKKSERGRGGKPSLVRHGSLWAGFVVACGDVEVVDKLLLVTVLFVDLTPVFVNLGRVVEGEQVVVVQGWIY